MKTLIVFLFLSLSCKGQQVDKVAHFGVGYVLGATSSALTSKQKPIVNISIGVGTGIIIGTAKELYDYRVKGQFNYKDLGATVLGSALGTITIRYTIRKTI
jgi:uncharacterized protein YfiM (DUF2279 family)